MQSSKDSLSGSSSDLSDAYSASFPGKYSDVRCSGGGSRTQRSNCSCPYWSATSFLLRPVSAPYMRSLRRHERSSGVTPGALASAASSVQPGSISAMTSSAVRTVRCRNDVYTLSKQMPLPARVRPAKRACSSPASLSSTSTHPVNRFALFHIDSPCLRKTTLPGSSGARIMPGNAPPSARALERGAARRARASRCCTGRAVLIRCASSVSATSNRPSDLLTTIRADAPIADATFCGFGHSPGFLPVAKSAAAATRPR